MSITRDLLLDPGHVASAARVQRILMAVNGSERSERGLAQVRALSRALGVDVEMVEVLTDKPDGWTPYLEDLARRYEMTEVHTVAAEDAVEGLVTQFGFGDAALGCIATAGADRTAPLLGSVAYSILDRMDQPVLLAGPESTWFGASPAPVVAGIDGTAEDAVVVAVAAGWAQRLGGPLHLVTVVEPVPAHPEGEPLRPSHGPERPAERLERLSACARALGIETVTRVIDDPVNVAAPFVDECRRVDAALVVVGSRRHAGLRRVVVGETAARIVRGSPALVLAVPLDWRR